MLNRLPRALLVAAIAFAGCRVELQHDLTEDDANDIYVLLQHNGIEATKHKEEGGNEPKYMIDVAKQDVADAAKLLREHSLPRPKADGLAVFKKMKGMIPTQTEERAMFIEALGGEVSNSLNRIPGVLEARTIVMIPEVNDLTQPEKKPLPTASVFIKFRPSADGKPPLTDLDVREFVAAAVPEMRKEAVKVLMTPAVLPDAEASADSRMQTVAGLRMTKSSAEQFKLFAVVGALLLVAMGGAVAWSFMRGSGSGSSRSGRSKAAAEG
jgi:type III secretion protein J